MVRASTEPCLLCREPASVTDWEPVAAWFAVEGCACGDFFVGSILWNRRLGPLSDIERKDVLARIQAARASGREAWLTTADGRIDGQLVVLTARPT
jgi:hypothetical protein